jgi:hypothetical protein
MESIRKVSQKTKNRTAIQSTDITPEHNICKVKFKFKFKSGCNKELDTYVNRSIFTMAKLWKQPRCPNE